MDIRQLEIFCRIVDMKSFSKAAKSLGLAQPTASGHIKALEGELNVRLFDRLGREVQPTKAGLLLLGYAQKILRIREEGRRAIEEFLGIIRGHLVLGASTIPGGFLLPDLVGRFKRRYPDTTINMEIISSQKVIDGVLTGKFPVGFTGAQRANDQLIFRRFARDELVLAVRPDHPLARRGSIQVRDLAEVDLLLRQEGSGTRSVAVERLRELGFTIKKSQIAAVLGDVQSVRSALKAGMGASIVSRLSVEEDFESGALKEVPIEGFACDREFYSVVHKSRNVSLLSRSFLRFAHESDEA